MEIRKIYVEVPCHLIITDAAGDHVMPEEPAARPDYVPPEEVPVPYTAKQKRLLRARAHGWKPTGKAKGLAKISPKKAAKLAKKPTRRKSSKKR